MRRLLVILMALSMAVSCVESQVEGGKEIQKDPVSECLVPSSARCGGEVILQWNGFTDDASVILRSDSGADESAELQVITDSGLIFNVPWSLVPGIYKVVLIQEGEHVLGEIEILAPEMPVSSVSVPSSCLAGESVLISGTGFDASSSILLVGEDGTEYMPDCVYGPGGISIIIPSDMSEGGYDVVLVQDGYEWPLDETIYVTAPTKELASVSYQGPYMGSVQIRYTWSVIDGDPLKIVLSEALVNADGTEDEGSYDEYVAVSGSGFELTVDGFESTNDLSMTYHLDDDGRVISSDVLVYGNSQPTDFTWTYGPDGALEEITYISRNGLMSFRALSYQDGNLVRFRNTLFEYADPSLMNDPNAPDVVWGYMAVMEKFDPFVYFPYLLGWYDVRSSALPTAMTIASGQGTVTLPIEYVFDEDGYVIEMKWSDGGANKVMFSYR